MRDIIVEPNFQKDNTLKDLIKRVHPQWHSILENSLSYMDANYLAKLKLDQDWLPGLDNIFAAFSQPLENVRYILLGESPYPRADSANGYAFWDSKVDQLWSANGLSKDVNRATSLRNMIKMLLVARGDLQQDTSQPAIASLDKSHLTQTAKALFGSFISKGFLLLNASLVYSEGGVVEHAKKWRPFIGSLLTQLSALNYQIELILFGRIAALLPEARLFPCILAEHPYNISFISNQDVLDFFKPLELLSYHAT